jgi:hypothetical protein
MIAASPENEFFGATKKSANSRQGEGTISDENGIA